MKRREFITLLGGAAAVWPLAARAQQPTMPVIAYLHSGALEMRHDEVAAFNRGLNETGLVEGRNVEIEYRWAEGQYNRLPALAADLVRRRVAVIVAVGASHPALAAKAATSTLPIVFQTGDDPVKLGLVASLNRPGSNLTGFTTLNTELEPKRLELLHELVPKAAIIAVLINPANPLRNERLLEDLQSAARTIGLQLHELRASNEHEFDAAFVTMLQLQAGGLIIPIDPLFISYSKQLIALAARDALPVIYSNREFAVAGGLMSYGANLREMFRQVGVYTGRILRGAKPADLPVVQPTEFELVINLKTAKALGIDVPPGLSARADEVIE